MSAIPDPALDALPATSALPGGPVELLLWLRAASDPRPVIESALRADGGALVWSGRVERLLIGEGELHWTHAALVQGRSERLVFDALRRNARAAGLAEVASRRFGRWRLPTAARALFGLLRFVGRWRRPAEPDPGLLALPASWLAAPSLYPSLDRLRAIAADRSPAQAYMLNLLAYRERAEYREGAWRSDVSGRAAYRRYGVVAARSVALLGGSVEHLGTLEGAVGDPAGLATSGDWDELAIVRYPRPRAIVQLEQMPGYARALLHRNAGLARTALIVSR